MIKSTDEENLNLVQGPGAAVEVGKKGKGGGKKGSKVGELFFLFFFSEDRRHCP